MHFWIDTRSQARGFGRDRIPASLSNSSGLGFGHHHPPRRLAGAAAAKPKTITAPIHRFQSQEFPIQSNLNQYQHQQNRHHLNNNLCMQNNCTVSSNHMNYNNYTSNNMSNNCIMRNHRQSNHFRTHLLQPGHERKNIQCNTNQQLYGSAQQNQQIQQIQQTQQYQTQQAQTQLILEIYETPPQAGIRNTNTQYSNSSIDSCNNHLSTLPANNNLNSNLMYSNQTSVANNSSSVHFVSMSPHVSGASSSNQHEHDEHVQDLEQGTMGGIMNAFRHFNINHDGHNSDDHHRSSHVNETLIGTPNQHNMVERRHESQILPSHLKCGIWLSLVLASVFVAGAKFYFDHQGTGLEVLVFCSVSTIFLLITCTVSMCRLPEDLVPPPASIRTNNILSSVNENLSSITLENQLYNNNSHQLQHDNQLLTPAAIAPPPYHLAILLPHRTNKLLDVDDTPPPSYDQIFI